MEQRSDFFEWLYIGSDLVIWAALSVILLFLVRFIRKKPGFFFPDALSLKTSLEFEKELSERRKSEAKFMGLLESAPDAMVITGADGKIRMVNAQTEKLFGFSRDEIVGKDVEALVPEKFHSKHIHHRSEYIANPKTRGMGIGMELYGKNKNGHEFPVEISLSPMKTDDEEGILVLAAIRDVTKQKEAEAEIIKLNANLEHLIVERTAELEHALMNEKAALTEMSRNQNRLAFLTRASEVLSSSLNYCELLGSLTNILTPAIADWCTIDEVMDDGSLRRMSVSHTDPDKIKYVYELSKKYPPDLASPQGIYRVILTHKPELYPYIADAFIADFARDKEHLRLLTAIGIKSALVVPLFIREKFFGVLSLGMAESGRNFDNTDLDFAMEIAKRAMLAIENAKLYNESQQINEELEHRIAIRTHELETINRELEAFSYSVSHDLRAPLRSIDGFSNKIMKDYSARLDEQGRDYFMRVKKASQHMGKLIDDLLKLSRLTRVEMYPELTNLSSIAELIAVDLKSTDPERNAGFFIQPDMIAKVDKSLMQIALQNLLGNAWKYTQKQPYASIEVGSYQENERTVYFVKDNGVGFDMKYVDKLFGAFQRLHGVLEFEGTGIGLATVQRIIHRHLGTIWAEGEVNKGATFYFTV